MPKKLPSTGPLFNTPRPPYFDSAAAERYGQMFIDLMSMDLTDPDAYDFGLEHGMEYCPPTVEGLRVGAELMRLAVDAVLLSGVEGGTETARRALLGASEGADERKTVMVETIGHFTRYFPWSFDDEAHDMFAPFVVYLERLAPEFSALAERRALVDSWFRRLTERSEEKHGRAAPSLFYVAAALSLEVGAFGASVREKERPPSKAVERIAKGFKRAWDRTRSRPPHTELRGDPWETPQGDSGG